MEQVRKLRIWMTLLALAATAAAVLLMLYFWQQFSQPYRQLEEQNAASSVAPVIDSDTLPLYDDSFQLVLVNSTHRLSSSFEPMLTELNGVQVERRIVPYLKKLLADAEDEGIDLQLKTGYVSEQAQTKQYEAAVQRYLNQGLSRMKAEDQARRTVGEGGYSEAQTGLSVQFETKESEKFETTAAYRWLMNHSIEYGFVLRYSESKTSFTRMESDASRFRFVGMKNATRMRELEMCLEEYANYIAIQKDS